MESKPLSRTLMEQFIGINGFVDDPIDKLAAVGHLREYHQWQWDEGNGEASYLGYPDHRIAWAPSWVSGSNWGWDFDEFYEKLKAANIEVVPCIQGRASYLSKDSNKSSDDKPVQEGADTLNPKSYAAHASFLYQFVARYGSAKVDESLLKLKGNQQRKSGLGLIHYIENCNEPDKWWKGRSGYFSPYELAAMCSADFDGHRGMLGPGHGVLTADPEIKLVMGGLARPEIEYLKAMKLWADFNRDGDFPAHVINLHHYSNDAGGQGTKAPSVGISPEEDHLKERFKRIVGYVRKNFKNKEVWVSEFGYDTNPKSVQRAPAIGTFSKEEVQGQWIIRSYLALAAAGVDRAQLFMLRDVNAENNVKYNSSGLTSEKWNKHQPKTAWFYVSAMKHVLTGTRFRKEIQSENKNVRIYRFASDSGDRMIDVVWCASSEQMAVKGASLPVPGDSLSCQLIQLSPKEKNGRREKLTIADGRVTIDISERPVFLEYGEN